MRRGLPQTLLALGLAACAGVPAATLPETPNTTTSVVAPSTTTSSAASVTTTTEPATTTSTLPREVEAEVFDPPGPGPHPAVVMVHGGSWVAGSPASLDALARRLQDDGYLVVNTRYTLATLSRPSFPAALDDIACAVRFAATHPESDGTVALIGHSAGAHLAAVVAVTGDAYGGGCPIEAPATATRFVGLAGPYDVTRIGIIAVPFFGSRPEEAPDIWAAANPIGLVVEGSGLNALLVHGADDSIVGTWFAEDFLTALTDAGLAATLEIIAGADHQDVTDPEFVGDLLLEWLETT